MKWDYFISYASEDRDSATRLMRALEEMGARCFIDHRDIPAGHPRYRDVLVEGLVDSECIVVLLSNHAQASGEVDLEMSVAHDHGRRRVAVWITDNGPFTNKTLEMLLAAGQHITWGHLSEQQVAQRIRATATVSSLRSQLNDYQSVVDQLQVDLSGVFERVDHDDLTGAVAQIRQISTAILRQLWDHYHVGGPAPLGMRDLIVGCRDHFAHESLLASFAEIEQTARDADLKRPSMDKTVKAIEQLMTVLSVLRTQRWGMHELSRRLRKDAAFLAGLLIEAGWLQGSELVPDPGVVYMMFERVSGQSKRYLEILLGDDEAAMEEISQQADGRIFPGTDVPLTTRFIVLAGDGSGSQDSGKFMTPESFVMRFTGIQPLPAPGLDPSPPAPGALADEVATHLANARGNVLVYGAPGVGKSQALKFLAVNGWPGAPQIRFLVDYAESDMSDVERTLDAQLAGRFPAEVRHRTRELVSYLVRTGRAALLLDSIECAATTDQQVQTARTFARLCTFLSLESTVVMAGRDAALRDSATVREFFMREPAVSDALAQTLRSSGVDSAGLPDFHMLRAKRRRGTVVATARDRLVDVLSTGIWDPREEAAAASLESVLATPKVTDPLPGWEPLTREQVVSAAVGGTPRGATGDLDLPGLDLTQVRSTRVLRELRAAIDYVQTATSGVAAQRWHDVSVGETTRRLVRLLSRIAVPDRRLATPLAMVGPASSVLAVAAPDRVGLAPSTVTAGQFADFLRALPTVSLNTLTPDLPDESQLYPMYERVPRGFYRDENRAAHPAIGVSWWAADSFARFVGGRLPTSLEWEIAGRGWDGRIFPWGDSPRADLINCADHSAGKPIVDYTSWRVAMQSGDIAPCAGRPSDPDCGNRSPGGQLDMVGNVWEWTATVVDGYRVIAGGSYDNPLRACVLSSRSVAVPRTRSNALGFRVVMQ